MILLQTNDVERRFGADVLFHNINNPRARIVGKKDFLSIK